MIRVFISYSHEDEDLKNQLVKHLSSLVTAEQVFVWHDRAIVGGEEWDREIWARLDQARMVLLLISASFLSSDYCRREMKQSVERHKSGTATVVPVILRPVDWEYAPISCLQALPKNARPITKWITPDDAFLDVVLGIKEVIKKMSTTHPPNSEADPEPPVNSAPQMDARKLQHETLRLLETAGKFIGSAANILGAQNIAKHKKRVAALDFERSRVENPELSMAVVAAMKAGKSTIINTILGEKILPSRDLAMTAIPTEVALRAGAHEPVLEISAEVREAFRCAEAKLATTLSQYGESFDREFEAYPHLRTLADDLRSKRLGDLPACMKGADLISTTLSRMNDVGRLLQLFLPEENMVCNTDTVPRITASLWQPPGLQYPEILGQLVIIDTPGPNEAGSPHLFGVVSRQLQSCSLVLLIMDCTQLQNDAEQRIRAEVDKVAELKGHENVYVLVNKIDQRSPEGLNSSDLVKLVVRSAGLRGRDPASRVFEVSAKEGLASSRYMQERRTAVGNPEGHETVEALLRLVRPVEWQEQLPGVTWSEMDQMAKRLWERSGFARFLDRAVSFLAEGVAPTVMSSALAAGASIVEGFGKDAVMRSSVLKKGTEYINQELAALEIDVQEIKSRRMAIQPAVSVKSLKTDIRKLLRLVRSEATKQVEAEIRLIADRVSGAKVRGARNVPWLSRLTADMTSYQPRTMRLIFSTRQAADAFATRTATHLTAQMQPFFEQAMSDAKNQLAEARRRCTNELQAAIEPVFERVASRLKQDLKVRWSLPVFRIGTRGLKLPAPRVEVMIKTVKPPPQIIKEKPFYFLWLLEVETIVEQPERTERHFACTLSALRDKATAAIEEKFDELRECIDTYIDERLQKATEDFFEHADDQLENCRTNLEEGQKVRGFTPEKRLQKQKELETLAADASNLYEQFEVLSEAVSELLSKNSLP